MIIYFNEEGAYLSWTARHRNGFVLDSLRRPTRKPPTLHRAICEAIRKSPTKKTHWTTGRRLKACSLDVEELVAWAKEEYGGDPDACEHCKPCDVARAEDLTSSETRHDHLTKLGKEILDFVIESAVIHLDQHDSEYALTVGGVADCVDKTPAQITAALLRLMEDGYVSMEGDVSPGAALDVERTIYPTGESLKMLPAFEQMSPEEVAAELQRLRNGG